MSKAGKDNIQAFLNNLEVIDSRLCFILKEMRSLVFEKFPHFKERIMYGGIVFFDESEMLCGLFAYKKHVSLELSNGSQMNDQFKVLEGKGKFRRHIKAFEMEDVEAKNVAYYLLQLI